MNKDAGRSDDNTMFLLLSTRVLLLVPCSPGQEEAASGPAGEQRNHNARKPLMYAHSLSVNVW